MTDLIALRHHLHAHPDVSGKEMGTADIIKEFLNTHKPDELIESVGGHGVVAIYHGEQEGPGVAFRCELDALPIQEVNEELAYRSTRQGVSHKCGHDGHMAMVASLASKLADSRPRSGKVMLIFQPAEETGEGARAMMQHDTFSSMNIDYLFAIHNLPGYPMGAVVLRDGVFASASKGLIIHLKGKTSHAAEPEHGLSPDIAMGEIIVMAKGIVADISLQSFGLCTVVHASLGSPSFGISPGQATIMCTLRAHYDQDLKEIETAIKEESKQIAFNHHLGIEFDESEAFQSTVNDTLCTALIKTAARRNDYRIERKKEPFRWSEDFGVMTDKWPGAMFGLGAGADTPDLHNPDYDFPDELIEVGSTMFGELVDLILNDK